MMWGPWSECQRETLGLPAWGAPNPGAELFRGSPVAPPAVPQSTSLLRRVNSGKLKHRVSWVGQERKR